MMHPPAQLRHRRRRGLSLVEAMISLVICTALLTSVGVAFVASSNAIKNNDEFTRAAQAARVSMAHLQSEIRTAWAIDPSTPTDGNGNTGQIKLLTSEATHNPDRTYKYDSTKKQLIMVTNAVPNDLDFVLVRNVTAAQFNIQKGTDASGATCVSQVGITITVAVGKNQVTLSGAAAPRRNLAK
jgi:Tfp pilus assembly protein PilW